MTDSHRTPSGAVSRRTADHTQRDTSVCMARGDAYGVATSSDGEIAKGADKGTVLGGTVAGAWFAAIPANSVRPTSASLTAACANAVMT